MGRAVSLRKRIANYFKPNLESRIKEMVGLACRIKYKKTENLLEAIILEANLIKKHWPKYNVREKDNRSFVYLVIPKRDFTKPIIARGGELKKFAPQKADIFGPYKSLTVLENALKIIRRIFPYSSCWIAKDAASKRKLKFNRPCLDYQIGLCPGVCLGVISKKDYQKNIDKIILLLKGRKKTLLKRLEKDNPFQAQALRHLRDAALISREDYYLSPRLNRIEAYDISHFSGKETYGSMAVSLNAKTTAKEYRLFKIREAPLSNDLAALEEVILRRLKHSEWRLPDLICLDGGKPQIDHLSKVFKKHNIRIPLLGISKYQNDKLIFSKNTKQSFKDLANAIKRTLLQVRDEAHRFAIKAGRRQRNKTVVKSKK